MVVDLREPELYDILQKYVNASLARMYVALPGTITNYDVSSKTCQVKPSIKKIYRNGDVVEMPIIRNVPVLFPQTKNSIISFPIEKGDEVLLIFSQRSIEDWKSKDGIVEPTDRRKFSISDAIAVPGLLRKGAGLQASNDYLLIQNGDLEIKTYDNGKIEVENQTNELISALNELNTELKNFSQEVSNITTLVLGAPVPPVNQALLAAYVPLFQAILAKLATFKV